MQHVDIIYLALGGSMPSYNPYYALADLEGGGVTGVATPLSNFKK